MRASESAFNGVRGEANVGQATTLDVLTSQQLLVNARISLVTAQHDRVVTSYNLLAAVGDLSPTVLGLQTPIYDPTVHYHQVRDSWLGLRELRMASSPARMALLGSPLAFVVSQSRAPPTPIDNPKSGISTSPKSASAKHHDYPKT